MIVANMNERFIFKGIVSHYSMTPSIMEGKKENSMCTNDTDLSLSIYININIWTVTLFDHSDFKPPNNRDD